VDIGVDIACYPYVDHDLEIETMANRAEVLKVESCYKKKA
jgi:hypothetical protein